MRTRHHASRLVPVGALVLALVACGGSDDGADDSGGGDDSGGASTEQAGAEAGSDDAGAAESSDDAGAESSGADDGDDGDGASGAGTNDEAQESLDDAGVDLDLDELEEDINDFSTGEGGGIVTIDGAAYAFEATAVCISQGNDFVAEGLGTGPDGEAVWVSVSASEFDFDDDGTPDPSVDVFVEVGKTELFGSGSDDAPDWSASWAAGLGMPEIAYELAGGSISGSGQIQDYNAVAIPFGESVPFTFEASCG